MIEVRTLYASSTLAAICLILLSFGISSAEEELPVPEAIIQVRSEPPNSPIGIWTMSYSEIFKSIHVCGFISCAILLFSIAPPVKREIHYQTRISLLIIAWQLAFIGILLKINSGFMFLATSHSHPDPPGPIQLFYYPIALGMLFQFVLSIPPLFGLLLSRIGRAEILKHTRSLASILLAFVDILVLSYVLSII